MMEILVIPVPVDVDFFHIVLILRLSLKSIHLDQKRRESSAAGRSPGQIPQDVVRITDFNFLSVLGKGSFGKVGFSSQMNRSNGFILTSVQFRNHSNR